MLVILISFSTFSLCKPDEPQGKLTLLVWEEGELNTQTNEMWFYFDATEGEEYYIEWDDKYVGTDSYTADVLISAYREDKETLYFEENDDGFGHSADKYDDDCAEPITALASEKVYLKVIPYESDTMGTFAIRAYQDTMPVTFDPPQGLYEGTQQITLSSETTDAIIRYTTDGTIPDRETGTIYEGAVTVDAETDIKAIAYKDTNIVSKLKSAFYYIGNVPTKKWTIMIWLAACNDLEPFAITDMNEIEYGLHLAQEGDPDILDNLNVIVQIDRIDGFEGFPYDDGDDWTDTRRYWMQPHNNDELGNDNVFVSRKIKELGEQNMGDVTNLKNFIEEVKTDFPAENYGLIFWNHGGGVRSPDSQKIAQPIKGVCYDYEEDPTDYLYVGEIKDPEAGGLTDTHSVDWFGIDACLMGMAEVAYEFRPGVSGEFSADYMTFSPQYEVGAGYEYTKVFNRFKGSGFTDDEGDPCYDIETITAEEIARIGAKEYADHYIPMGDGSGNQTQTAVDLAYITDVKTNLDLLASELDTAEAKTFIQTLQETSVPDLPYDGENNEPPTVDDGSVIMYMWNKYLYKNLDLWEFAHEIDITTDPAITAQAKTYAQALMTSVEDVILESYGLAQPEYDDGYLGWENHKNGLAFFWPDAIQIENDNNPDRPYMLQWYTNIDSAENYTYLDSDDVEHPLLYGKLDFLDSDGDGEVESWKELIEYYYDNDNSLTPTEQW